MTKAQGQWTPPSAQRLRRKEDSFSPVNDFFAPFFDVVFYRSSPLQGTIESLEEQLRIVPAQARGSILAQLAGLRTAQSGLSAITKFPIDIVGEQELGASRISLRSTGGGLQTFDPAGADSPLGQLVNYRANLQVTMLSAAALQATLTLTPPYEDALRIIDSQLIKFGTLMEIQWGYLSTDGGQPAISDKGLFVIQQPSIKFGRETIITIGGFDILSTSLKSQDVRCCWSRNTYPCDLHILRKLFSKSAPDGVNLIDSAVSAKSSLRKNKKENVIQADDDWTFFRRLCRQNDVSFVPSGRDILLKDESRIDIETPKYRLTWFMQPQGVLDIPMISFETNPIMGYFAGAGSRGQRTFCRDSETGLIEILNRDPSDTGTAQVGESASDATERGHPTNRVLVGDGSDIAAYGELVEACASGRIFTQPCNRPNQREETDRENREVRRYHNTRATAIVPGVPGLLPQQIVEIVNVGDVFSGNYRIMKAVHNIGAGYTIKVDLLRASSTGTKDGTAATRDRANNQPLNPKEQIGEKVSPVAGGDPPILSTAAASSGCVDEIATTEQSATRAAEAIIRAAEESLLD